MHDISFLDIELQKECSLYLFFVLPKQNINETITGNATKIFLCNDKTVTKTISLQNCAIIFSTKKCNYTYCIKELATSVDANLHI